MSEPPTNQGASMRAAVLHGREDVRIEQVPTRSLQPGEVRLRIEAALTCGTDLKVFKRGYHARMIVPPAVFGHEMAGTIAETYPPTGPAGDSADFRWRVGQQVVVANSAPCGNCPACRRQQENLCDDLLFLNGAYAESIVVPSRLVAKNLLLLSSHTAYADAALVEPLACVVQGMKDAHVTAGQRVLILGAGPIGLMFVALAARLGCEVTVAGRGQNRLQRAQMLGAARVIDVGNAGGSVAPDPKTDDGHDVVIEAVGKPETWQAAVGLVRKGGVVNFFGGCPTGTSVTLDTALLHYSSITLVASFHHTPQTIREALHYIEAGAIRAADFVDGACELGELPDLFRSMAAGNRAVKTLVRVDANR